MDCCVCVPCQVCVLWVFVHTSVCMGVWVGGCVCGCVRMWVCEYVCV